MTVSSFEQLRFIARQTKFLNECTHKTAYNPILLFMKDGEPPQQPGPVCGIL